jgi:hypothetical protein
MGHVRMNVCSSSLICFSICWIIISHWWGWQATKHAKKSITLTFSIIKRQRLSYTFEKIPRSQDTMSFIQFIFVSFFILYILLEMRIIKSKTSGPWHRVHAWNLAKNSGLSFATSKCFFMQMRLLFNVLTRAKKAEWTLGKDGDGRCCKSSQLFQLFADALQAILLHVYEK